MVRRSLEQTTGVGMKQNQAATEYAVMRQEANSSHALYMRVQQKVQEAGLSAAFTLPTWWSWIRPASR